MDWACFVVVLFGGPIAVCIGILFYFREEHHVKVREPLAAIILGLLDVAGIAMIYFRSTGSMACESILWAGHICLNLASAITVFRAWTIKVKSDRTLRNRFHSFTRSKFLLQILFGVLIYTCSVISIDKYARHGGNSTRNECYFLLPLTCSVPFAAILVIVRSFVAYEISKYATKNRDKSPDHLGVSKELLLSSLLSTLIASIYFPYALYCSLPHTPNHFRTADSLFVMMPFANGLVSVIVPAIRTLTSVKLHSGPGDVIRRIFICQRTPKVLCSPISTKYSCGNGVHKILHDTQQASLFRKFAQKMLCAESVDFCLEVIEFKKVILEAQENGLVSDLALFGQYSSILEEFVLNDSPCEVNISGTLKARLLKHKTLEAFRTLCLDEIAVIFDQAVEEIEKLLNDNLLNLFMKSSIIP